MATRPLQPGDPAPNFTLPAVNRDGVVSLDDYRGSRAVLVGLFRGLHCPFCRRQITRLSMVQEALTREGVDAVAVVNTPLERAQQYFRYRPTRVLLAVDPDVVTHHAFGLWEVTMLADDADPKQVHWPETFTIARLAEATTLARPELPQPTNIFAAMDLLNQQDAFEPTETDRRMAEAHGFQGGGYFLIDAEGIVRWTFIEAEDQAAAVCRFPGDDEIVAAARAIGRH